MKTTLAVVVVLTLAAAACGPGPVKREDLNAEVAKAVCSNYTKCGISRTEAGCLDLLQSFLSPTNSSTDFYGALIEAGKVKYDPVRARRCLDSYATMACTNTLFTTVNEDCLRTYEGQVAVAGGCSSIECVPSAWCSPQPTGGCPGTCKARVAAGGTASSFSECAIGLVLVNGTCATPSAEGAACVEMFFPSTCAAGLFCAADTKTCKKFKLEGEACSATSPCSGYNSCANGVCAKPGDLGATCGTGASSVLPCKIDLTCDLSKANPVCSEKFGEGAICRASGLGTDCKSSLRCSAGQGTSMLTCQKPGLAGEGCVSGSCSTDLFCETSSKTCKAVLVAGSVCTQADSCKAGSFCTSGVCKNLVTSMVCN